VNPLEPLPLQRPATPLPAAERSPAADRKASPPAASGRQPAGVSAAPLEASFRFEELARQIVITLVRPETREVVRQIPPDKILKLIVYLRQAAAHAFDREA